LKGLYALQEFNQAGQYNLSVMSKKLSPFLFPIILAIFPALSLYVHNMHQLRIHEVIWTIVIIIFIVILLLLAFWKLYGSVHKGAILTATLFLLFFSYGHVNRSMSFVLSSLGLLDKTTYLVRGETADILWLLVWVGLFAAVAFLLYKYPKDLSFASQFLTWISVAVLFTVFGQWIFEVYRQPAQQIDAWISKWVEDSHDKYYSQVCNATDNLPDIYYIILDGMGREDVLKDIYLADISDFRTYLEQRGFYIASESRSNYAWTELSLTSSLNFMYLDDMKALGSETSDTTPLEIMVENNHLFAILRKHGYQIVTFSDEFSLTDISSSDVYLMPQRWAVNGYQNELINTTPLPSLFRIFSFETPYDLHRDHIQFMFKNLAQPSELERPKFVFAHFMAPHPPFVFDANGEPVTPDVEFTFNFGVDKIGQSAFISGYRDQVHFTTNRLMHELDTILERTSGRPLIVIIQGDHGPSLRLDWTSVENTDHTSELLPGGSGPIFQLQSTLIGEQELFYSALPPICFSGRYRKINI
jgi:hypothetical protein